MRETKYVKKVEHNHSSSSTIQDWFRSFDKPELSEPTNTDRSPGSVDTDEMVSDAVALVA